MHYYFIIFFAVFLDIWDKAVIYPQHFIHHLVLKPSASDVYSSINLFEHIAEGVNKHNHSCWRSFKKNLICYSSEQTSYCCLLFSITQAIINRLNLDPKQSSACFINTFTQQYCLILVFALQRRCKAPSSHLSRRQLPAQLTLNPIVPHFKLFCMFPRHLLKVLWCLLEEK